ncbi:MAG TPA: efflux RND transporter periplasmic adaptor subunit [Xanthobacteraceae bacterium]|jgi:RND family efflux transporter MFP subunit
MKKRNLVLGVAAVLALAAVVGAKSDLFPASWNPWSPQGAVAQAPRGQAERAVPVDVAVAAKKRVPVRVDLLGSVTPIASVAVKTRVDTEILAVHFQDGATVQQGDILFTLDARATEAQLHQAEGMLAKDQAQLEGAERDVRRYTDLVSKGATPVTNLDNAKTQVATFEGAIKADQALIENLKVQIGYCTIRAQISGHVSMATVKVGNFVRQADLTPIATIIQTAPVYVTFSLPQRSLPELRAALANESANIEAIVPGDPRKASGQVTMIENAVDPTTGTVPVRATMPNTDEILWPGTLVTVRLNFREEEAVTVPSIAIQAGQSGSYVFVVKDGVASVQPVKVARSLETETILASGLEGGETVVTEGQLLLRNGTKVSARQIKTGS